MRRTLTVLLTAALLTVGAAPASAATRDWERYDHQQACRLVALYGHRTASFLMSRQAPQSCTGVSVKNYGPAFTKR